MSNESTPSTLENEVGREILNEDDPDLDQLFSFFNKIYFYNELVDVKVKWSTRLTQSAGTHRRRQGKSFIRLSVPLLKPRPKIDLYETLLHEMIHALSHLTNRNTKKGGHGKEFFEEASRISEEGIYKISEFHDFHKEIKQTLTHVWKCDRACRDIKPYYGTVKRSNNRPPPKAGRWFERHKQECGGTFIKVAEPPKKEKKQRKKNAGTN